MKPAGRSSYTTDTAGHTGAVARHGSRIQKLKKNLVPTETDEIWKIRDSAVVD
jgi:hypothetical protein